MSILVLVRSRENLQPRRNVVSHCESVTQQVIQLARKLLVYGNVSQPPGRGLEPGHGINYNEPSSYKEENLPGRGLTELRTTGLWDVSIRRHYRR